MWALKEKSIFLTSQASYFSCRTSVLPQDWWISLLLFQISFLSFVIRPLSGESAHGQTDVSLLDWVYVLSPAFFKCQTDQHAFLHCEFFWRMTSWDRKLAFIGPVFSLDQYLSQTVASNHCSQKECRKLPWPGTDFCSLRPSGSSRRPLGICICCWPRGWLLSSVTLE